MHRLPAVTQGPRQSTTPPVDASLLADFERHLEAERGLSPGR